MEPGKLPAQFAPDRPGRAGNHHDLAPDRVADLVRFQVHRSASEKILDGDIANLGGESVALDDLCESGDGLIGSAAFVAILEGARHFRAGGGRHGDENRLDVLGRNDGGERSAIPEDPYPVNEAASLRRSVVYEAGDVVRECGVLLDLAEQRDARIAGSINERAFPGAQIRHAGEFEGQPHGQAGSRGQPKTEHEIQKINGARETLGSECQKNQAAQNGPGNVCRREPGKIANGGVSPPSSIHFEEVKCPDLGRHQDADPRQQVGPEVLWNDEVKPQQKRQHARRCEYGELN